MRNFVFRDRFHHLTLVGWVRRQIVVFHVWRQGGQGLWKCHSVLDRLLGLLYPQLCWVWWGGICPGRSGGGVCDVCCDVCNHRGCVPTFGMPLHMGSLRPFWGGSIYSVHLCMCVLFCIVWVGQMSLVVCWGTVWLVWGSAECNSR